MKSLGSVAKSTRVIEEHRRALLAEERKFIRKIIATWGARAPRRAELISLRFSKCPIYQILSRVGGHGRKYGDHTARTRWTDDGVEGGRGRREPRRSPRRLFQNTPRHRAAVEREASSLGAAKLMYTIGTRYNFARGAEGGPGERERGARARGVS